MAITGGPQGWVQPAFHSTTSHGILNSPSQRPAIVLLTSTSPEPLTSTSPDVTIVTTEPPGFIKTSQRMRNTDYDSPTAHTQHSLITALFLPPEPLQFGVAALIKWTMQLLPSLLDGATIGEMFNPRVDGRIQTMSSTQKTISILPRKTTLSKPTSNSDQTFF